ncbi:hypothetical protein HMPREF1705_04674 [Acetomicrobium hydrogeniformans ATCC BAA-1850]|uniref:Uncharacterized protein n=1 Tax=Acetomicrobium hydrogeniformans ATCC BAA-1850 TaxID=592015 RepID=A0A0T5XCS6_9BACT|nr:hypothetical protein HMPREF1705_04674 [Acetomicrobium hydrogeniformans ATCC BAA-1850]
MRSQQIPFKDHPSFNCQGTRQISIFFESVLLKAQEVYPAHYFTECLIIPQGRSQKSPYNKKSGKKILSRLR